MRMRVCPTCRRPLGDLRLGVCLPPVKSRIFDAVAAAGDIGLTAREIITACYGRPSVQVACIKSHMHQLNLMLALSGWRLVPEGRREARWHLVGPLGWWPRQWSSHGKEAAAARADVRR